MKQSSLRLLSLFMVIFIDTFGYFLVMLAIQGLVFSPHGLLPSQTSTQERQWLLEITLMLSPLAFITLSPIAGRLSDRIGRKRIIGYCLIASLLGFVIPLLGIAYKQLWLVMLGRFIAGAGTTSQPIAQAAITDFSSGKRKAFNLGLIGLSMTLAMVLGPLGAGYCKGFTTPYWIGTVLAVLNLILLATTFTETHPPETTAITLCERFGLLNKPILYLLCAFLLGELVWSGYYQAAYLGFLHKEFNLSQTQIGTFMAYVGAWMCLGLTVIYRLGLKFFSPRTLCQLSIITFTISLITLLSINTVQAHWLLIPVVALTFGIFYPSILFLISERTPQHSQGWMLGVASQLLGLAWMVTFFSIGFSSHIILSACCTLSLIAILSFYLGEKKHGSSTSAAR
jgi:MFS family permease